MVEKKTSFDNFVKDFYEIEEKYDLFNIKENDVYIWKIIRFYVFFKLLSKKQGVEAIHLNNNENKKIKLLSVLINAILKNPVLKKRKEILVIDHPRKVKFNNLEIDPYTYYFLKDLSKDQYELLERRYVGKYKKSVCSTNSTMDFFSILNRINKKFKRVSLTEELSNTLDNLEKELYQKFHTDINLKKLAYEKLSEFISLRQIFGYYLKMKKPKELYVVVSYNLEPYVAAAQDNGIRVIEFQHGVMGPFHVGYHFPFNDDIPYFPDEIKMFGEFWNQITDLPSKTIKTFVGFPHLEEQIKPYQDRLDCKYQNKIVIISQGTIGEKLSNLIFELAKIIPEYEIIYKLHPGEFGRWRKEYKKLVELEKMSNVQIVENEVPLYDLFAQSQFVIGVNSTAIFEAIAFKVQPIIVKLPSYEMMKVLNEKYKVPLIDTAEQAKAYIENNSDNNGLKVDVNSIFKSPSAN